MVGYGGDRGQYVGVVRWPVTREGVAAHYVKELCARGSIAELFRGVVREG